MERALVIVAILVLGIPALVGTMWAVHVALDRLCVVHARRFCRRRGLLVRRSRVEMAFDGTGVKTESSVVELDCLDAQGRQRSVRLLVWPLGVRRVVEDGPYPESQDRQRPRADGP